MARIEHTAAARSLALLRVAAGSVFLIAASGKFIFGSLIGAVPAPMVSATWQRELPAKLALWLGQHPEGVVSAVVRDVLLPHGTLVAGCIAWLQLLAGLLLILGLFTRTASLLAGIIALSLALAASARHGLDARPYLLLVAMSVAFILGRAGDVFGCDGLRDERRRYREF
jgi:uncharacterized membrane protein YphA (DoxX/SURF4 family)